MKGVETAWQEYLDSLGPAGRDLFDDRAYLPVFKAGYEAACKFRKDRDRIDLIDPILPRMEDLCPFHDLGMESGECICTKAPS